MKLEKTFRLFGIKINMLEYDEFIKYIEYVINQNLRTRITYVTANSLNIIYDDPSMADTFRKFEVIHPDGVGIYLASRILYYKEGMRVRVTGSDFYPLLIAKASEKRWKIFLLGDGDENLERARLRNPGFNIIGTQNGFHFDNDELVKRINSSGADILFVGMGCPKQERWIIENKDRIDIKVIIATGEGIKVLAGVKKRGLPIVRTLGLEWMVRLLNNPRIYWRRYLLGNPLFVWRVIKYKIQNHRNKVV
ncbi:MAG: WecB/TagA/CpsF family glycosyltransferase [Ignavibacteriales bacterium]